MEKLLLNIPDEIDIHTIGQFKFIAINQDGTQIELEEPSIERVRILIPKETLKEKKRIYRSKYNKRHAEELRERYESEEFKQKRKRYNELPEVKARKRELAFIRRTAVNVLKRQNPVIFKNVMQESRKISQLNGDRA